MNPPLESLEQVTDNTSAPATEVVWHHTAFCRLALPLRAPRSDWQRRVGTASAQIETNGQPLPSGMLLRLTLLSLCDTAYRTRIPVMELGEDSAALAARLGLPHKAAETAEQVERILASRITVSLDGGPELAMLDARGRPRTGGSRWRPTIRLSSGFLAHLTQHAVPLDRRIVQALSASPSAFDAYAWVRQALHGLGAQDVAHARWDDLLKAFGTKSQDLAAFRTGFDAALRRVSEADLSVLLQISEDGVSLRKAVAVRTEARPAGGVLRPAARPGSPSSASAELTREGELPELRADEKGRADTLPPAKHPSLPQTLSLGPELTGLPFVIWVRQGYGAEGVLVGVTPGERFDPDRLTLLAVEPMVVQIRGGLDRRGFDQASAWVMANRDLIDDLWSGQVASLVEVHRRVRKVPAPGWR